MVGFRIWPTRSESLLAGDLRTAQQQGAGNVQFQEYGIQGSLAELPGVCTRGVSELLSLGLRGPPLD